MKFTEQGALVERGIAYAGYGQTSEAMQAYAKIVDPGTLEVVPAFQGSITEGGRLNKIMRMAEASLSGNVRNMGEAIRYWEYVGNFGIKSKHLESEISRIYRAMRLARECEARVTKLSELLREKTIPQSRETK
jgi:hypothetical protein